MVRVPTGSPRSDTPVTYTRVVPSSRFCQLLGGGGAGFVGDGGAGQHARDLLAALALVERCDGGDGVAAEGFLADAPVLVGERGDLRRMGDDQQIGRAHV